MMSWLVMLWMVGSAAMPNPTAARSAPTKGAVHAKTARHVVEKLQRFYQHTADFSADFTQVYRYKIGHRTQKSSGKVLFKNPGLMRWDYLVPTKRTFVLADQHAYMLDPQALTLTKTSLKQNRLSAAVTFLWGKGNLSDEFEISEAPCKKCSGVRLELVPKKPSPQFRRVYLEVNPKTGQVLRTTWIDPDGSENTITFEHLKRNVGLSQDAFKLAPPPGTQIIDMTKRAP